MNLRTTLTGLALLLATTACASEDPPAAQEPAAQSSTTRSPSAEPATNASDDGDLMDPPLTNGWQTQEEVGSDGTVTGPARDMEPIELTACGRSVRFDPADRVGAELSSIEDFRQRAVGRFPDESEADAAVAHLVGLFEDCPEEPQDALTELHRVTGDAMSDCGALITTSFTYDDAGALGSDAVVVFQRGRTVLVSTMSSEGMGQEHARRLARQQVHQLRPVLAELR
jgi:hypothetical protein